MVLLLCSVTAGACRDDGGITVRRLDFKGVKAVDEARLKEAVATRQSAQLPWGRKRFFDRSRLDEDRKRIEAFYADRGYPDARVTSVDVTFNDKKDAVDVIATISEGEPVTVTAIDFVGFEIIPADHLEKLQSDVPLETGHPRDRQLIVLSRDMALNELRDHGYPYAKVTSTESGGAGGTQTTVVFTAEPGLLAHFGPVEIADNKSVGENVIRRELAYKPGDLYRRSVLLDSQRRLYGMALFQFVNVAATLDPDRHDAEVRTKVTVNEGKHQRVNVGVGYGSEEKGRVDAEYHHLNFFGAARSAGVHGRWSSLDRGVLLDFNQPYLLGLHVSLGVEAQQWSTFTPAYESVVTGAKAAVVHRGSPQMSWSVSIASERSSSTIAEDALDDPELRDDLIALGLDPTTGKQEGTLSPIGFDLQRSTADSLLNPRHGHQLALHAEEAGVLLPGTANYYAVSIEGRDYQSIGDRLVVASRLQLGNIGAAGSGATNVPFSRKYFLGGSTSMRGWSRYEVSPLSSSGLPLGGNSLLAFTTEVRATVRGNLGAVFFLDAGNVWAESWGFALNDLRYAIGPGFRYQTPVGPVRFDVGYQLNPIEGLVVNGELQTRRLRFHFSIGQAF